MQLRPGLSEKVPAEHRSRLEGAGRYKHVLQNIAPYLSVHGALLFRGNNSLETAGFEGMFRSTG